MHRNRSSINKKRDERTAQARNTFDPLTLESKSASTALLLLQDTDAMVVAQALAALDRFAVKAPENAAQLIGLNILPPLMPLIEHAEYPVRRFATKLLAELCCHEETKKLLLSEPPKITYLSEVLIKEVDVPIQEFSSEILAELTKMHVACEIILDTGVIDVLFQRIKSIDPDVQHNSARVMLNLLRDPDAIDVFLKRPAFDFLPILRLLQSEYPAIQNVAIDVLDMLTKQRENKELLETFKQAKGLEDLVDILEMFDWKDLHLGILGVISNVADNPMMVHHMSISNLVRRLLMYMDDIHDDPYVEMVLEIISKIATVDIGRKTLMEYNAADVLLRCIRDDNPAIARAACVAVGNLMQNVQALEVFAKDNPMREIIGIMKNETLPWATRHGALMALCNMLEKDKAFCDLFLSLNQQETLFQILKQPLEKTAPVEMLVTVLHTIAVCGATEETRTKMLETDFTELIITQLESQDAQLQIAACFCLSTYASEPLVQQHFAAENGATKLMDCLKSPFMPVRQAAASLLQLLALDSKVAEMFINMDALDWMMGQKDAQNVCPAWETAIETLFGSCLYAKFYYLGHIDIQDVTREVFYVLRKPTRRFLILDKLLSARANPITIIYVANFGGPSTAERQKLLKTSDGGKRNLGRKSEVPSSPRSRDEYDMYSHGRLLYDHYLIEYVEQVKKLLKTTEEKCVRFTIPQKAAVLASFVANKMCGLSKASSCTNHICNLHITELKLELSSSIIPLGFIRVGMHLERAMLFKVLADQVGIPCALVRGEYGRTWIEIAFPQAQPWEGKQPLHVEDLPKRLVKPNCIIDLMDDPGRLLPIGSFEAAKYCALPSALF